MSKDFHFIPVEDRKSLDKLIKFLKPQSLNYPNWETWIDKVYFETLSGYKEAMILKTNGEVVGDVICQPHKELKWLYEFKNIRIHPQFRNRFCASFLAKQVEYKARELFSAIVVDLKSSEKETFQFFLRMGYFPIGEKPLYDGTNPDTIMIKTFNEKTKSQITSLTKEIIMGKSNSQNL
ncbi:MAG: hypothetical protein NUV46_00405 [Nanoarchaeota archaeon]|nr:hypothetical protein [Nanoarchaeota archaeon]